jgi:hypothetical protein
MARMREMIFSSLSYVKKLCARGARLEGQNLDEILKLTLSDLKGLKTLYQMEIT